MSNTGSSAVSSSMPGLSLTHMSAPLTEFKKSLEERSQFLANLEEEMMKRLKTAPKGTLRISRHRNTDQYYYREKRTDQRGKYIRKENQELAVRLAQKGYEEDLLKRAHQEHNAIDAFLKHFPGNGPERLYGELTDSRKMLVTPVLETDEMFVKRWKDCRYEGKEFPKDFPELLTEKGERVRSKSEMIIANMLEGAHIPYRYEYPIRLKGMGKIYPDFTVLSLRLRREIYWEHLGMMDDPEYAEKAIRKITAYHMNNIYPGERLILTMETKTTPINVRQLKRIIAHYFTQEQ